jgi:hypothetical protein
MIAYRLVHPQQPPQLQDVPKLAWQHGGGELCLALLGKTVVRG